MEALERRQLMALASDTPWGGNPRLIRQDEQVADFPTLTGDGVGVAIIDTGIDYTHPLLVGDNPGFGPGHKVVGGWDFVDNDPDPMDTFGHGTAVAGVVGANEFENEGRKYRGVAPNAHLIALRVDAANDEVPDSRIEAALEWVLAHRVEFKIAAVNISFGSGHFDTTHSSPYSDELALLKERGVFVAAASGNGGVTEPFGVQYPAADASVFAVGAVDKFDAITEWCERGPNLDILAPGDDVKALGLGPDEVELISGTSFACPVVVGAVALMRQANPALKVADEYSILHASSKSNVDGDAEFGTVTNLTYDRIDLHDAVALAVARAPRDGGGVPADEIAAAGNGNALAYDSFGVLHAVYYDSIEHNLKYLTRNTDGALSDAQVVDTSGHDVGGYVSLAIDSHARPGVAYFDGTAGDLRFAHFNGATWDVETVDAPGSVGLYPSITYDAGDHAVISYFRKTRGDLRVARENDDDDAETGWTIDAVDVQFIVGRSTDIARDADTGEIVVAYEDSTHGWLKVARLASGGAWATSVVDNLTIGVTHTSIAFDASHRPAVSYYDIHHADLKFTHFDGVGAWNTQRLASKGAQGLYTELYFSADGAANILYYNRKNNLVMKVTGGIPDWTAEPLQSNGGRYIALAVNPLDDTVTYTWFEPGVAKLRVADL
jgi:subtilisin family serine protease